MVQGADASRRWGPLARLWEPHASITQEGERRRARVAMALLLAMAALGMVNVTLTFSGLYGRPSWDSVLELGIILALVAAYLLARSGLVALGVLLAVAGIEFALVYYRSEALPGPGELTMLYFLSIPILLAGLLMRARDASLVAIFTIALAMLVELHFDGVFEFDIDDIGLLLMLVAVALLSVTAAALNDRDAQLLQETTTLLKQVTDNIPEVMFVVSGDGKRMLYTSPAYETVLGRKVEQAMADPRDWVKAVHPEDLPYVLKGLQTNQPDLRYRALHASGDLKHIRARTFPVLGADGKATSLVGLAEDVTAAVQSEERLREAQRQRVRLMQQLAHDMASPLTPVKLQLRILKDSLAGQGAKGLDIIRRNTDHLERLVADVRDVARLEGGDLKVFRKPVDVADLARQAVESHGSSAAERQVRVVADVPASAPIQADAGRVTQVMYNLIGNALKFTPPGGQVTVAVTHTDNDVKVDVRDTGNGMTPEQIARLFKPFSQVHDPSAIQRAEDKGSGLGLYISKGLVEAHGGSIAASSDGPGTGSTFTFRLPVAS